MYIDNEIEDMLFASLIPSSVNHIYSDVWQHWTHQYYYSLDYKHS